MSGERVRVRDLVILIPGITGSVLQKDGKDVWAPSLRAIFSAAATAGGSLRQLALNGDDHEVDDLGDGIRATALIQDARIVPGLIKIDGYTKVAEMLLECFELTEGSSDSEIKPDRPANFFQFPYDWRRDNRVASRRLKCLIDLRLKEWRKQAGDEAKVILIAHSMGGIIARHYLEVLGGWETCKALMTFGTPFRGSVKALNFLADGGKLFSLLTDLARSFTSVYQLLPIYKVVNVDGDWKRVAELELPGINVQKAQEALTFHREIMDCVDGRLKAGNKEPYVLFPVVGTYQPTLQSAELAGGRLTASDGLPPLYDKLLGHGDGTVPYLSAIPHELSTAYRNNFYAECHSSIHCNEPVLDFIYNQLRDMQVLSLANIRGPEISPKARRRAAISLFVRDVYQAGEPVVISARVLEDGEVMTNEDRYREHVASLTATVEPTECLAEPFVAAFRRAGDEWVLTLVGLAPGLYRVAVRPGKRGPLAPTPVHDLFQVAVAA